MQSNELKIRCVVPCLLGLESLIAQELRDMGAIDVAAENGRVLFSGDANLLARANINCRFAERIQILIGSFPARTFDELFEGTKALPWEAWIGREDAFPVKGYSNQSYPGVQWDVRDSAWRYVTILDLPFSLVFDTLLLPIDIHHGPYE